MSKIATVRALSDSANPQLQIVREMQALQAELEALRKDLATMQARPEPAAKLTERLDSSAARLASLITTSATLPGELRDAQSTLCQSAKELASAAALARQQPLWLRMLGGLAAAFLAAVLALAWQTFLNPDRAELPALLDRATPEEQAWIKRIAARPAPPSK